MLGKILAIYVGSITLAIGVNFFLVPFHILDGGMIGIGLIFKYLWGLKAGAVIILLSIPMYILAWFHFRGYFYNSIHGLIVSSLFIDLIQPYHFHYIHKLDLTSLTSSLLGGVFVGLGIGIMLRYDTSTGGTDLLALLLARFLSINVGVIILFIDLIVISLGGILISKETFLFSVYTIFIVGLLTSLCTRKKFVKVL